MKEAEFQKGLKAKIKMLMPESIVFKTDCTQLQGMPDLLILNGEKWGALEVKRDEKSSHRPNQDYYVDKLDSMSFCRFIYPENEEVVLNELQEALC